METYRILNTSNTQEVTVEANTERGARIKGARAMNISYSWTTVAIPREDYLDLDEHVAQGGTVDAQASTPVETMGAPDLVIDGVPYMRSFVADLLPGEVTVFGETVERLDYIGQDRYRITMTNGYATVYGALSTTLIRIEA